MCGYEFKGTLDTVGHDKNLIGDDAKGSADTHD